MCIRDRCDIEQSRRPAPNGDFVERISAFLNLDKSEHELLLDLAAKSRNTVSVSYTHLDVYKRQVVNQVKADPGNTDLRTFIREELFGCLFSALFNQKGRAFAHYYYGEIDAPYYPADIDDYALKYFGPSRYHSNEFQQEDVYKRQDKSNERDTLGILLYTKASGCFAHWLLSWF